MDIKEYYKLIALRELNKTYIKNHKKELCKLFTNDIDKKECIKAFNKSFVSSFVNRAIELNS
jgi:hypothetical protein